MNLHIEKGTKNDIKKVAELYDELIDYLTERTNYPGWKKGVYPTVEDAEKGINDGELFVVKDGENIAGTIILSHEPEHGYDTVKWLCDADYKDIYVIRTFAVHPSYLKKGIGKMLMKFADEQAALHNIKSIRLDVFRKNIPAINLYESCGYKYLDTIDEGYGMYGLDLFRIYEKVVMRCGMNEEKLLDKTLCVLDEEGADSAYKFLFDNREEIKEPTAQLYNFLYCLAAVSGHNEEALNFMEEAIIQKKMWYRSEVFDDEDLNSIVDTQRFKECRKVSDERYLEALKNTYTYFSWLHKTADKLAVALHGNQQNVEICRENWQFLNNEEYQIEYVQSKDIDSINLFRWEEESRPQLPAVLSKIDNESYSEVLLCGFSAGCNEILKSILDKPDICNKIFLASPWIPVINSECEKIAEKIAEHNIEVSIYCGKKDDDCYPLAVSFEKMLKNKSVKVKTVYTEKEAHEFPENPAKILGGLLD